jgi:hypothetical protein
MYQYTRVKLSSENMMIRSNRSPSSSIYKKKICLHYIFIVTYVCETYFSSDMHSWWFFVQHVHIFVKCMFMMKKKKRSKFSLYSLWTFFCDQRMYVFDDRMTSKLKSQKKVQCVFFSLSLSLFIFWFLKNKR